MNINPTELTSAATSLDIVLDQVKERIAVQDAQISALDGKANFGLASASLLITGVAGLLSTLSSTQPTGQARNIAMFGTSIQATTVVNTLTIAAFTAYVAVVITAYMAYRILDFRVVPIPNKFVEKYLNKPQEYTKKRLLRTMVSAFHENERLVSKKIFWTSWVLRSLIIQAVLLLSLTVIQIAL